MNSTAKRGAVRQRGKLLENAKLRSGEGKTLRRRGGDLTVTDGPFAESKEILGGFWMIDAASYDKAVARWDPDGIAKGCVISSARPAATT